MRAKEYMLQVDRMNRIITNKLIEKEQWQSMAMSTGSISEGERVQSSGSQDKMADAVCKYVEIEKEIDRCIDRLVDVKVDVINTIEQLPAIEYDLLHKIYIQNKTLYQVADEEDKSYSWVTTVHGRALKNVQDILDKK